MDLNDYKLLDEWALQHGCNIVVYTFDETIKYFKVEYQTPNLNVYINIHVLKILKTSIDDIIIAYHAITDKDALLKQFCAFYKPSKEELAEAHAKHFIEIAKIIIHTVIQLQIIMKSKKENSKNLSVDILVIF